MIIQLWRVNNEQNEKPIVLILLYLMWRSARTGSSRRCGRSTLTAIVLFSALKPMTAHCCLGLLCNLFAIATFHGWTKLCCPCVEGNCQCFFCTASRMWQVTVPCVVEAPPSVESVSIFSKEKVSSPSPCLLEMCLFRVLVFLSFRASPCLSSPLVTL